MAQKKQKYSVKKSRKTSGVGNTASKKKSDGKSAVKESRSTVRFRHFTPFILLMVSALIGISFIVSDFGVVGNFIRDDVLFGIFSKAAYVLPLILIAYALLMLFEKSLAPQKGRLICVTVIFLMVTVFFHVFFAPEGTEKLINPIVHYKNGVNGIGGGFVGGFLGSLMVTCFSKIGSAIIVFAVSIAMILVIIGKTPREVVEDISYTGEVHRERRRIAKLEAEKEDRYREERRRAEYEERQRIFEEETRRRYSKQAQGGYPEYEPFDDGELKPYDPAIYGEIERKVEIDPNLVDDDDYGAGVADETDVSVKDGNSEQLPIPDETEIDKLFPVAETVTPETLDDDDGVSVFENPEDEEIIERLQKRYLGDDGTISVATFDVMADSGADGNKGEKKLGVPSNDVKGETECSVREKYVFPKIDFLIKDKARKTADSTKELRDKEKLLIETLQEFGVKTESAGLPSKGPTVTRYEIRPAPGTRVRSILNLSDDIALSMAAPGVRIGPVPEKNAIGVEVPNDTKEIVRLRDLIESDNFEKAESKLCVALGKDVAGAPVFFNIADMPHMLIAGATGMGKSVCINCLIVSILYKASPDDVKLILIDPKKVEFALYANLPHLLVPVVTDPKKAAGALSWAVNEMERRYGLIESVGARNIKGYNEVAENDPSMEKLANIVIIIDEFADLMMTAPDSVENSVCRLAQKARAAGMHMLIGTQRPSVDVITGTIKSNIPSRIACKTSSQVDSRTILDVVGAEKLIGKGDMLFSPVGSSKPTRVQGAFVTDGEISEIVDYISEKNTDVGEINSDIMSEIETEAAKCSKKKGSASSDDSSAVPASGEEDVMFWRAVELAVDSGKISTSLLQRKCSIGFGRAAKLIDRMEDLGYVTPPEGQKPRRVLITRERLDEIKASSQATSKSDDGDDDLF